MNKNNVILALAVVVLGALAVMLVLFLREFTIIDMYNWYKEHMTYGMIVLLMAIESSIIPLPSEVVVPPAAYFALRSGNMDITMVVIMATVGAFLGALANYVLSMLLGRPVLYAFADSKLGHMLMLNSEKLKHAEDYFSRKGAISIFLGRLLPAVRHLISIPAGLSRMNIFTFSTFTILGAALWNVALALMGYWLSLAVPEEQLLDAIEHYNGYIKIGGYALIAALVAYVCYKSFKGKKGKRDAAEEAVNSDNETKAKDEENVKAEVE